MTLRKMIFNVCPLIKNNYVDEHETFQPKMKANWYRYAKDCDSNNVASRKYTEKKGEKTPKMTQNVKKKVSHAPRIIPSKNPSILGKKVCSVARARTYPHRQTHRHETLYSCISYAC